MKYLDDRPVFPRERAMAEAWDRGGVEAENEERQLWINKERRRVQEAVEWVNRLRKNAHEKKLKALEDGVEVEEDEEEKEEGVRVDGKPGKPTLEFR